MTTHIDPPAPQRHAEDTSMRPAVPGRKRPWYRRTWVAAVAALIVGLTVGAAGASGQDPTTSPQYKRVVAQRDQARQDLAATQHELGSAQSELRDAKSQMKNLVGNLPAREAKVSKAEKRLAAEQASLKAREESVAKRERKVGIVERTIARNTVPGDGMYKVGTDMAAGTYKTSGAPSCYYAVLNSANTFNIATNNNASGPAFVTVQDGKYFQTERCADWVLQH